MNEEEFKQMKQLVQVQQQIWVQQQLNQNQQNLSPILDSSSGKPKYTCPGRHGLKAFNTPNVYHCSVCHGTFSQGTTMYGCRSCDYDLCDSCNSGATPKLDSSGKPTCCGHHGLKVFNVQNGMIMRCNVCHVYFNKGEKFHGCRTCDYDLCDSCHNLCEDKKPQYDHEEKENTLGYNSDVVNQLVQLNYGTLEQCISASKKVIDYNDINAVVIKLKELEQDNDHEMSNFTSELNELINVIEGRMRFMKQQEGNVNKLIAESDQKELLKNAKKKALETENELLGQIKNLSNINLFLTNIILIENLFNSEYNNKQRLNQSNARKKYARNISKYERKQKPICKVGSFVELLFGAKTDLGSFKKFLKLVDEQCKQKNINMISNSGAKEKNIERAFYKTYYVYSVVYGSNGFQQMTDVLRCSLVFDNFDDLYQCFGVIEHLSANNGGILRCKDRFNPQEISFGYRDLLINIKCPGSEIICEVQLHHKLFYDHKKISHDMYKKARLFERNDVNLAYKYADKFTRPGIGMKIYEYSGGGKDEILSLLTEWGLSGYRQILINEGWDDIAYWKEISLNELKDMGFKSGHAKKFVAKAQSM